MVSETPKCRSKEVDFELAVDDVPAKPETDMINSVSPPSAYDPFFFQKYPRKGDVILGVRLDENGDIICPDIDLMAASKAALEAEYKPPRVEDKPSSELLLSKSDPDADSSVASSLDELFTDISDMEWELSIARAVDEDVVTDMLDMEWELSIARAVDEDVITDILDMERELSVARAVDEDVVTDMLDMEWELSIARAVDEDVVTDILDMEGELSVARAVDEDVVTDILDMERELSIAWAVDEDVVTDILDMEWELSIARAVDEDVVTDILDMERELSIARAVDEDVVTDILDMEWELSMARAVDEDVITDILDMDSRKGEKETLTVVVLLTINVLVERPTSKSKYDEINHKLCLFPDDDGFSSFLSLYLNGVRAKALPSVCQNTSMVETWKSREVGTQQTLQLVWASKGFLPLLPLNESKKASRSGGPPPSLYSTFWLPPIERNCNVKSTSLQLKLGFPHREGGAQSTQSQNLKTANCDCEFPSFPDHFVICGEMGTLRIPEVVPSPAQDCWGTDEEGIIWFLGHRNADQRRKIRDTYQQLYNKSLMDDLHSELSDSSVASSLDELFTDILDMEWELSIARAVDEDVVTNMLDMEWELSIARAVDEDVITDILDMERALSVARAVDEDVVTDMLDMEWELSIARAVDEDVVTDILDMEWELSVARAVDEDVVTDILDMERELSIARAVDEDVVTDILDMEWELSIARAVDEDVVTDILDMERELCIARAVDEDVVTDHHKAKPKLQDDEG
ncbi:hypothetical protein Ancab_006273 [Ancistrocladus abbreviatus]